MFTASFLVVYWYTVLISGGMHSVKILWHLRKRPWKKKQPRFGLMKHARMSRIALFSGNSARESSICFIIVPYQDGSATCAQYGSALSSLRSFIRCLARSGPSFSGWARAILVLCMFYFLGYFSWTMVTILVSLLTVLTSLANHGLCCCMSPSWGP